jgi:hypothetical protein
VPTSLPLMPPAPWPSPLLLSQESVAVEGQLGYLVERLFTPTGIAAAAALSGLLILVFIIRKPLPILGGVVMALGCAVLPARIGENQLIGPLQSLRFLSKSLAFALLAIVVFLALPGISRGDRIRSAGFAATSFFAFQMLYTLQFMLFAGDGLMKGAFGIVATTVMYLTFAVGFGRRMQDRASATSTLEVFAWVGVVFAALNSIQIVFGLSGALMGGRLAGIAGNAQMMGGISACLIVANAYLYAELPATRPLRWVCLACVGILGILLLATGSRTAVLAVSAGLFVMFRLQVGRFAIFGIVALIAYSAVSLFLESPTEAVAERLTSGADTRSAIWLDALGRFLGSPIFGELMFLRPGDSPSGVESTILRTLANMGVIGGIALLVPVFAAAGCALKSIGLARERPEYARLVDFQFGALTVFLVLNLFDGYAFGFLTFPVLFIYVVLALGAFLAEQAEAAPGGVLDEDGLLVPGY